MKRILILTLLLCSLAFSTACAANNKKPPKPETPKAATDAQSQYLLGKQYDEGKTSRRRIITKR